MSYKPDEKDWMAYLYGELGGQEKEKFEQYLLENDDARTELERYQGLRNMMSALEDKEVIAPPIVLGDGQKMLFWNTPYFKTILSIAASFILIILFAKLSGAQMSISGNEFKLSFGKPAQITPVAENIPVNTLSEAQVQQMISAAMQNNNEVLKTSLKESEEKLAASVRKNLAANSGRVDQLVREASTASQDQIRQYISGIQTENMQAVRDYFQLTSTEQKKYIENLLVDFSAYLQQQRNNDLQLVQTRMNSLEQNTDSFKQETEQILTSIITSVGSSPNKEIKN
jgi:hypothetical protein